MRVNARFEGEYERQLTFLTQATGLGVSEVLKESVAHDYRVVSAAAQSCWLTCADSWASQ